MNSWMSQRRLQTGLRSLIGLLAATLTFVSGTVLAQEETPAAPWSVYLGSYADVQLHQLNPDGSVVDFPLPPGSENSFSLDAFAFSPDSSRVAMCVTPPSDPNAAVPSAGYTLTVYDLAAQSSLFELPVGEVVACSTTGEAFSQDGSRLALGIITQFPAGPETPQPDSSWQLLVVDSTTGDTVATLDALNPGLSALGVDSAQQFVMPYVRRVEGDLVYFTLVNYATEGLPSYDAFAWNTTDNSVVEAPLWGRPFSGDEILTADGYEFAYTMLDENQPAAIPGGPVPTANTVMIERKGGEPQVVYTNTEEIITGVRYIHDGGALAIGLLEASDPSSGEMPGQEDVRYVMLSRDGTLTEIVAPLSGGQVQLLPIPGGYIQYTGVYNMENGTQNITIDSVTGDGTTNLATDDTGTLGVLLYATRPDLSAASLPEFVPATSS